LNTTGLEDHELK